MVLGRRRLGLREGVIGRLAWFPSIGVAARWNLAYESIGEVARWNLAYVGGGGAKLHRRRSF
jgi:hypothetical protein